MKDLATGKLIRLTDSPLRDSHAIATTDGSKVAWCRSSPKGDAVCLLDADHGGSEKLYQGCFCPWDWSPDGNLLYFTSDRDGFRCIWAQRLDPQTKHPVGEAFEVYPFHRTGLSPMNIGLGYFGISLAPDKIVINLGELTGNIWIADLAEGP